MQDNWMENNSLWLKGQLLVKNHLESEIASLSITIPGYLFAVSNKAGPKIIKS